MCVYFSSEKMYTDFLVDVSYCICFERQNVHKFGDSVFSQWWLEVINLIYKMWFTPEEDFSFTL